MLIPFVERAAHPIGHAALVGWLDLNPLQGAERAADGFNLLLRCLLLLFHRLEARQHIAEFIDYAFQRIFDFLDLLHDRLDGGFRGRGFIAA